MITLVVFTDGRWDVLDRTLRSASTHLLGPISSVHLVVDGHGPDEADALLTHPSVLWPNVPVREHWSAQRLGFGGTIRAAWERLAHAAEVPFVFHLEDDFTFTRAVDLRAMARVLSHQPDLAQMALRRQPVNDREIAAGGILQALGATFEECSDFEGHAWMEHRAFWTTNPSLYRRDWCSLGWPDGAHSEGLWTHQLLADPLVSFGYWGRYNDEPWVIHDGAVRVGKGY